MITHNSSLLVVVVSFWTIEVQTSDDHIDPLFLFFFRIFCSSRWVELKSFYDIQMVTFMKNTGKGLFDF